MFRHLLCLVFVSAISTFAYSDPPELPIVNIIVCGNITDEACIATFATSPCRGCEEDPCDGDFETQKQSNIYNAHTDALPGFPGFNTLTFTGSVVCSKKRDCTECRFINLSFQCKAAVGVDFENFVSKATFVLSSPCTGTL